MDTAWVFVIWFLLADGTIPQAKLSEPYKSWSECDVARQQAPFPPPLGSIGYILTNCRTGTQLLKEVAR